MLGACLLRSAPVQRVLGGNPLISTPTVPDLSSDAARYSSDCRDRTLGSQGRAGCQRHGCVVGVVPCAEVTGQRGHRGPGRRPAGAPGGDGNPVGRCTRLAGERRGGRSAGTHGPERGGAVDGGATRWGRRVGARHRFGWVDPGGHGAAGRIGALWRAVDGLADVVLVDVGVPSARDGMVEPAATAGADDLRRAAVLAAANNVVVIRACYLALRRFRGLNLRCDSAVLVREPQRALSRGDVADTLDAPVSATVELDPAVARSVDSGMLVSRLPRRLDRTMAALADLLLVDGVHAAAASERKSAG